jgi:hypothetical protein
MIGERPSCSISMRPMMPHLPWTFGRLSTPGGRLMASGQMAAGQAACWLCCRNRPGFELLSTELADVSVGCRAHPPRFGKPPNDSGPDG